MRNQEKGTSARNRTRPSSAPAVTVSSRCRLYAAENSLYLDRLRERLLGLELSSWRKLLFELYLFLSHSYLLYSAVNSGTPHRAENDELESLMTDRASLRKSLQYSGNSTWKPIPYFTAALQIVSARCSRTAPTGFNSLAQITEHRKLSVVGTTGGSVEHDAGGLAPCSLIWIFYSRRQYRVVVDVAVVDF